MINLLNLPIPEKLPEPFINPKNENDVLEAYKYLVDENVPVLRHQSLLPSKRL